jgi:hypothetical protein
VQDHAPTILVAPNAPALNIHLAADRWEADCPSCGYTLAWARTQDALDALAARIAICPICHQGAA